MYGSDKFRSQAPIFSQSTPSSSLLCFTIRTHLVEKCYGVPGASYGVFFPWHHVVAPVCSIIVTTA